MFALKFCSQVKRTTDKHETPQEAGRELNSRTWDYELSFDPATKMEILPEMAGPRKLPLNSFILPA